MSLPKKCSCGCTDFYLRKASYNAALYCRNCDSVVGRVRTEDDIRIMVNRMKTYEGRHGDGKHALKVIRVINGVTKYRCSACKALLFTSDDPEFGGQVSLRDEAKYCPMCGKEFLLTVH